MMHFNSVPAPVCESFTSIAPPGKENEWEVDCSHCGLNPMCRLLAYGDERAELPEGLLLRRERVARGETIFRKGDPFRSIFAVKSGSFMSVVNGSKDAEQVVGFHFAGELMGAEGLAEGYYPYTARALESCSVCELRMERLQETGCSVEKIQQGIIMLLGSQVAHNHALSASLIRQNGEQRLAAFILGVVNRLCANDMPTVEFRLNMSRADIACYLGLSRETVSRGLMKFQKEGAIKVLGKLIRLEDLHQLTKLAGA